jgi:hypothetical protein
MIYIRNRGRQEPGNIFRNRETYKAAGSLGPQVFGTQVFGTQVFGKQVFGKQGFGKQMLLPD